MPATDLELLLRFSRDGDETAFTTLVDRHLPMVYSAACRILSTEKHLAPDIAQRVFTNLVARLPRVIAYMEAAALARVEDGSSPPSVMGWLHRDTRFAAMEILRRESRRRRRETVAAHTDVVSEDSEPDWSRLRLFLDESLDELSDSDREALLLRFFHDHDSGAIGAVLGTSEEAARKRIGRALERLRERLTARGIFCTSAALALVFESQGLEAPPAGLLPRIARQALSFAAPPPVSTLTSFSSLMSSTLLKTVVITGVLGLGVVLTLQWAGRRSVESVSGRSSPETRTPASARPMMDPTDGARARVGTRSRAQAVAGADAAEVAALSRLRELLYAADARPARVSPDPRIRSVIEEWAGSRRIFVPLLQEALVDERREVVTRAASGVMVLGPEAVDCGPELIVALRKNSAGHTIASLGFALARIGPAPDLLPGVLAVLREKPQHNVAFTECLGSLVGDDFEAVHAALSPLLRDRDPLLQELAASVLVKSTGSTPDPEMLRIAIASLSSDNLNSQHLGLDILGRVGTGPGQGADPVDARRLGDAADDVVVALIHVANHSQLAERRARARKLLDQLEPTLRQDNPDFDRWLSEQEATERFRRKMVAGDVGIAELQDGLSRHPDASHEAAKRLAAYGSAARAALPSLHQALAALEPSETDSRFDRSTKLERRGQIVDAMRKLAPDQPSPIFSRGDVRLIFEPLSALSGPGAVAGRAEALQEVLAPLLTEGLEPGEKLRPDQLRQILVSIGKVDPGLRDAMLAAAQSVDPTFR